MGLVSNVVLFPLDFQLFNFNLDAIKVTANGGEFVIKENTF